MAKTGEHAGGLGIMGNKAEKITSSINSQVGHKCPYYPCSENRSQPIS